MATNRTEVVVHTRLPFALHARLRRKCFDEGLPMKAAVLAAIEDWVAPAKRHSPAPDLDQVRREGAQHVLDLFNQGPRDNLPREQVRANVQIYLESLGADPRI